jgi:formate dehydrogenase iron-sulfur subunit
VIDRNHEDGRAWKCTLCYDRQKDGLQPACAKACPTASIQFGDVDTLRVRARERVRQLHELGVTEAYLYGEDGASQPGTGGLNAFFLLLDKPEVYNLPPNPEVPTHKGKKSWISAGLAALGISAIALASAVLGNGGRERV